MKTELCTEQQCFHSFNSALHLHYNILVSYLPRIIFLLRYVTQGAQVVRRAYTASQFRSISSRIKRCLSPDYMRLELTSASKVSKSTPVIWVERRHWWCNASRKKFCTCLVSWGGEATGAAGLPQEL